MLLVGVEAFGLLMGLLVGIAFCDRTEKISACIFCCCCWSSWFCFCSARSCCFIALFVGGVLWLPWFIVGGYDDESFLVLLGGEEDMDASYTAPESMQLLQGRPTVPWLLHMGQYPTPVE